jgi:putative transposase
LELALRSGLKVFTTMLEEDRTAICGPRYAHEPDRPASRAGTTRSEVVLGGRKVTIQRPRVRTAAGEVPLPTFQTMAATDPLDRRAWLDSSRLEIIGTINDGYVIIPRV